ncbi:hypothetical protein Pmar_PMAR002013 [Perkinsus marinus ATCC 50983]|uniref:Uncharacterized protein n=1 Tax=Perkinsus marinus (strain ATCC 50983 / TXsc) TaxID=423536 RepID=C5LYF7_PERM5|nr:hypothetical protein Pmar_PMAR002013 [Perkinsus marinus ATCC 50983]EEQ98195.1 hypothetical protein Pmar_PMAR002013 [Perkinsus marinus ATCC 50983]|eukprot:XP_002765478.1 hypothetical protein Pmar_PMAR002013 [Perkinsus marinus ATCC 50983]
MTRSRLAETSSDSFSFNPATYLNLLHNNGMQPSHIDGITSRPRSGSDVSLKWMSACHPCRLDEGDLESIDPDLAASPSTVASVSASPSPLYRPSSSKGVTFGDQVLVRFYESPEPETLAEGENSSAGVDENAHEEPYPAGVVLDTDTVVKSFDGHSSRVVHSGALVCEFGDLDELRQWAASMGKRPTPSARNRSRTCAMDEISLMIEEDSRPRYERRGGRRRFYSEQGRRRSYLDVRDDDDDDEEALLARMEAMPCDQDLL